MFSPIKWISTKLKFVYSNYKQTWQIFRQKFGSRFSLMRDNKENLKKYHKCAKTSLSKECSLVDGVGVVSETVTMVTRFKLSDLVSSSWRPCCVVCCFPPLLLSSIRRGGMGTSPSTQSFKLSIWSSVSAWWSSTVFPEIEIMFVKWYQRKSVRKISWFPKWHCSSVSSLSWSRIIKMLL